MTWNYCLKLYELSILSYKTKIKLSWKAILEIRDLTAQWMEDSSAVIIASEGFFLLALGPNGEENLLRNKGNWLVNHRYLSDGKACQQRHSASTICQLNKQVHFLCVYILICSRSLNKIVFFWPEINITDDFIVLWCINE